MPRPIPRLPPVTSATGRSSMQETPNVSILNHANTTCQCSAATGGSARSRAPSGRGGTDCSRNLRLPRQLEKQLFHVFFAVFAAQLAQRARVEDPPAMHDRDAVAQFLDLRHDV